MKILANDGISIAGIQLLEKNGFEVITTKVAQEQVANYINKHNISVLLVRGATKVKKEIIDHCATLKIIGGVGLEARNVDTNYALSKGIHVITTPSASAVSVAELVFAHLFSGVRFLADANRNMPLEGDTQFNELRKSYAHGKELRGKTLGLVGFGGAAQEAAKIAIGLGMRVMVCDANIKTAVITLDFFDGKSVDFTVDTVPFDEVLAQSDFISVHGHGASQDELFIGAAEFDKMKEGVGFINTFKGGIINEVELIEALETGKVAFAGLDVFQDEPTPAVQILMHPNISLTPHIGSLTLENQNRIAEQWALQIISILK